MKARHTALLEVLKMLRDAEVAEMAEISEKCALLRQEHADWKARRGGDAPKWSDVSVAAEVTAQQQWADWRATKLSDLASDLAILEAQREQQKSVARRAFGRVDALERLIRKHPPAKTRRA